MQTQAALVARKGAPYEIEDVDIAPLRPDEVLVEVAACGVCHTDDVVKHQLIPVPLPAVLGHEGSGTVLEVGAGVDDLRPGDHVCFSYGSCGRCPECLAARPFQCERFNAINFGGTMPDGTTRLSHGGGPVSSFFAQSAFARHAVVHRNGLVRLDPDVDLHLAAPLGCGIQTGAGAVLNRLRPTVGSSIAVFGCGTVGMSAIMAARLAGCAQIVAVGGNPASLELAEELGATATVNRHEHPDTAARVKQLTGGVHYAIDTSGVSSMVRSALASCRPGGTAVVLGATGDLTINVQAELMGDNKSLIGIVEGEAVPALFIPILLEYHRQGRFPFDRLIRFYSFDQINQAVDDSASGKVIKAVLTMC
ncbi:zinc-binding dehydrogenase [Brooklawnia cerclae]|uniref:Aryl-alcohol dehydrogenase n=1 Tax=Brooklawnia cerclae TaxID=349934 RepID=A0ABX0SC28_9ACTN|nr:NAD(P)-dependent alcohol dehydrogenase [Brooklawnia cerclae]NIH55585.1 aryl-alcohol dehydrogenase [Brooklawnia cerclae]